jgi:hypothetical protein
LNEQERAELEKTLREMNAETRARSGVEGYDEMSFEQRLAASARGTITAILATLGAPSRLQWRRRARKTDQRLRNRSK